MSLITRSKRRKSSPTTKVTKVTGEALQCEQQTSEEDEVNFYVELGCFASAVVDFDQKYKYLQEYPPYQVVRMILSDKNNYDQVYKKTNSASRLIKICKGNISEAFDQYLREHMNSFSPQEVKSKGKVYTPQSIIDWIHDQLEKQSPLSLDKTYFEPACGTGRFVTDWYDRLLRHWEDNQSLYPEIKDRNQAHKHIIEKCLYFSDMDLQAVRLTRFSLFLKNPEVNFTELKINSLVGDSLLDQPFGDRKFDYMAGNPPWIGFNTKNGNLRLSSEQKEKYKKQYDESYNRYGDIFHLFVSLSCKRAKQAGFVTSRHWLGIESNSRKVKHFLQKENSIVAIWDHENISQFNIAERSACFIIKQEKGLTCDVFSESQQLKFHRSQNENYIDPEPEPRVSLRGVHLEDICYLDGGLQVLDKSSDLDTEPVGHPILSSGTFVGFYSLDKTKIKYVDRQKIVCNNEVKMRRWSSPGILVKFYTYGDARYGFTLDENGAYWGSDSQIHKVVSKGNTSIKGVLAILNSNIGRYYLCDPLNEKRPGYYMLPTTFYKKMPLPNKDLSELEPLVDKMLANPNDKQTEQQINQIVYKLYDLSKEEIEIVENVNIK